MKTVSGTTIIIVLTSLLYLRADAQEECPECSPPCTGTYICINGTCYDTGGVGELAPVSPEAVPESPYPYRKNLIVGYVLGGVGALIMLSSLAEDTVENRYVPLAIGGALLAGSGFNFAVGFSRKRKHDSWIRKQADGQVVSLSIRMNLPCSVGGNKTDE